jgi:autotransporter-associated beta strand protein
MRLRQHLLATAACGLAAWVLGQSAQAQTIAEGQTVKISTLSNTASPSFQGGTLEVDKSGTYAITPNFSPSTASQLANTIDAFGNAGVFTGVFSDGSAGVGGDLTIADSVGGGSITMTAISTYTGPTTINSGATLALTGTGSIASSGTVTVNGTYDISGTSAGAELFSLAGSGNVLLGAQTLRIDSASTVFAGTISGTGGLTITGGAQTLDGTNTYTGGTSITSNGGLEIGDSDTNGSIVGNVSDAGVLVFNRTDTVTFSQTISGVGSVTQAGGGTLVFNTVQPYTGTTTITLGTIALTGTGSIAASSDVSDTGTFDISGTNSGASIKSLTGPGNVALGAETLTITSASGIFTGAISGTGGLVLSGGNEVLSGTNTYTGGTTITAGTLQIGGGATTGAVVGNIVDGTTTTAATVAFDYSNAQNFTGVISGTGGMNLTSGTLTLSAAQTYTGPTTISTGTLVLAPGASIAASSGVTVNGTLDISQTTGASINALSGSGIILLGSTGTPAVGAALTINNGGGTFAGVIQGAGSVTLNGTSAEIFSGVNSYTGDTVIGSGATLGLLQTSALATSPVEDNGTLDVSGATNTLSNLVLVSIPSLSGSGKVTLGTNTLVLTDADDTFSGAITGTGGVTVSSGTETLTGASSFTGTLAIGSGASVALSGGGSLSSSALVSLSSQGTSVGTLDLSSASGAVTFGSLAGQGTVTLGSNSLTLASGSGDFTGTISGSGGLAVSGGTQILSGSNTYTGGTSTLSGGTLQLGDGGAGGTIIGNVADAGTLAFDYSGTTIFSGTISGAGGINQLGAGTTVLTAANSYTGGTTITAGTLQIGNGGTVGSFPGNVTDNGTLAFDHSDSVNFTGTISGSGGVSQIGGGTLILGAVNTYTGATTIASGSVLQLGAPNSIAASSQVADNGTFDISNMTAPQISSLAGSGTVTLGSQTLQITNGSTSFSGAITGSGGLAVSGGTQTLAGTNSYTGATAVNGGTLSVTGSIASSSSVTVNSGGTLGGMGTVSGVSVNSGGTVAPGVAGKGTLNVNGPASFAGGSTFLIDASSTTSPSVAVSGNANLAGTIAVSSVDGTYPVGQKLTVLTASGNVSGTFTAAAIPALNTGGAQFAPAVSTDAHDVFLQINLSKLSPLLPSGATRNETNAVGGIDAALAKGSTPSIAFDNLGNLSSAALGTDAQQLAGELGGDIPQVGNALYAPFQNAVFDHIADIGLQHQLVHHAALQSGPEVWLSAIGSTDIVSGNPSDGSQKFSSSSVGLVGGGDWHMSPNMLLGAALSLGSTHFHIGSGLGTGKATAYQAGLYGFLQFTPRIYGSFLGAFGQDNITTSRTLTVSGTDTLGASFTSQVFGGRYETGVNLGWIIPYIAGEDRLVRTPSHGESATSGSSAFALNYGSNTTNTPDIELGARQVADIPLTPNWALHLSDRLAWEHTLYPAFDAPASFAALPGPDFTTFGAQPAKNAALVSLGAQFRSRYGLAMGLEVEDALSAKSNSYNGIFTLGVGW